MYRVVSIKTTYLVVDDARAKLPAPRPVQRVMQCHQQHHSKEQLQEDDVETNDIERGTLRDAVVDTPRVWEPSVVNVRLGAQHAKHEVELDHLR